MGFSLKGYVLEKPRVGSANSAFTPGPDNLISDEPSYTGVYGTDESTPGRTEYLTLALVDGDLADAEFGWTKNEAGVQRFGYEGMEQRFKPLPGNLRTLLGTLEADTNTNRLVASIPTASSSVAPYRVSVGSVGSGTSFTVITVAVDGDFTTPTAGTVQLSLESGNLNWNSSDVTSYLGQDVYYQRQNFFEYAESTGFLGDASGSVILNPIPGLGVGAAYQLPLVRFGFGLHLTPVSVANESSFSADPVGGTFEWARDTGLVKFNSTDSVVNAGEPVYYDGVLFASGLTLPRQLIGTVSAPTVIAGVPDEGADLIFRAFAGGLLTGTATFSSTVLLQDGAADFVASGVELGDVVVLASGARRAITSVATTQLGVAPPIPSVSSTTYSIEQKSQIHQFAEVSRVGVLTPPGTFGVVQVDGAGNVLFSDSDQLFYGVQDVEVVFGDLPLERGLSMRFFRSPVDLEGVDPLVKDVSSFVVSAEASLADPIIGTPFVSLPVLPIDDAAYPIGFEVQQGTGVFTGSLPRLDTASPPTGIGFTLDYASRFFNFARRRNNEVIPNSAPTAVTSLLEPLVNPANPLFELDQGAGYVTLVEGQDYLLDAAGGLVKYVASEGDVVISSSSGVVSVLDTLEDPSADFVTAGVVAGDLVVIPTGTLAGVYTVASVTSATELEVSPAFALVATGVQYVVRRGKEILADRFFQEVILVDLLTKVEKIRSLGTVSNSPRLSVNVGDVNDVRFRFASGNFSTTTVVANDGAFTAPASLTAGVVEVSSSTGNLNFSQTDVTAGGSVYSAVRLSQKTDYNFSAALGLIQFTERMLASDEVLVTYASSSNPDVYQEERATFLVRKEVAEHATPTSVVSFNLLGRSVASVPAPSVFRGGRPQSSSQVQVNTTTSQIIFLPDVLPTSGGAFVVTDALPHGATVSPDERVYIDYYVYEAIGGENTITVLNPPISLAQISSGDGTLTGIQDGESAFTIKGDWTASFSANNLMRVGNDDLHNITASSYDGTRTTVTVGSPFRDSFTDPKIYVSSGEVRTTASGTEPSYYILETASYETVPRGMNRFKINGDRTADYQGGVIAYFSSGSVQEFYLVTGSTYDEDRDQTEVTINRTTARQYGSPYVLRRSVRPIYEASTTTVQADGSPIVIPPAETVEDSILIYRRVEGEVGVILQSPDDYSINDAGVVELTSPLLPSEEVAILYTRSRVVGAGSLRASYTATIVPTGDNGLANQKLVANLTSYLPDSFYFRVETLTNFRAEVADDYSDTAKASAPSGGARTENTASLTLQDQGSESTYFNEGHLSNEDIIARYTLKWYNDCINKLERLLRNLDGRVVGDRDGLFKFDGTTGSVVTSFGAADNQIDDRFKISDFPINPGPPLFPLTFVGTHKDAYEASTYSRFYPTYRSKFGYTVGGADTSAQTGDEILDFEVKNIKSVKGQIERRSPRAVLTVSAKSGDTTIYVDATGQVDEAPYRPAFVNSVQVVIRDSSTVYVPESTPLEVSGLSPTSLSFTAGLPVDVPIGATVYLAASDTVYRKIYRPGFDLTLDVENGYVLYVEPYPPYDGGGPTDIQTPNANELLQAGLYINNSLTAPYRFPALDGKPLDDDGDQQLPLVNPDPVRELGSPGLLETELSYVAAGGVFAANTVAPFIGTGDLDGTATVITLTAGTFPTPLPQVGDLVRTLDGLNGESDFRRVSAVTASSVTVDVAFPLVDTGFSFLVTVADNLASGSFDSIASTVVSDSLASFITAGVKPGHTVVLMQIGAGYLERRQVQSVDSPTQLTLIAAFSSAVTPALYRVHNPLNTYSEIWDLTAAPTDLLGVLQDNANSEVNVIDDFFDLVMLDRLSPITASGTVAGTTLTGIGVDFVASGVQAGDYVYVPPAQANQGFYLIQDVTDAVTLEVASAFPSAGAVTFRVANVFTASEKTLTDILDLRASAVDFYDDTTSWSTLVSTSVDVQVPPGVVDVTYFAMGYTPTDISNRESQITARQTYLSTSITSVESALVSSDRFYDKRYVWIDARINLETGILIRQKRAVADRLKAREETLKQLTKLLAVQQ